MTQDEPTAFDLDYLQRMSNQNRKNLNTDPADLSSRLSLAWHLFFQALHFKQQRLFWDRLLGQSEQQGETFHDILRNLQTETLRTSGDPRRLLKESLMQAAMVQQLSADPRERGEAARIQELAGMMGEDQVLEEVDVEAQKILSRVARAIYMEKREKTRLASHRRDMFDDDLDDF